MRQTPRVLSIHMSMAARYWQSSFAGGEAAPIIAQNMSEIVRGIQLYLQHPYERDVLDLECVHQWDESSLCALPGHDYECEAPVILLIPSLINKCHVLDLKPDRSMLRFFCAQNMHAYVLDWGVLAADQNTYSFDDMIMQKILNAAAFLRNKHGRKIHVLGYCMGGTIAAMTCAKTPDDVAGLIALAAPWDFAAGSGALTSRVQFWAPTLLPLLKNNGAMSVEWLQMLFASLDSSLTLQKFARFAAMDQEGAEAELFVAIEDWLNDGVALPGALAEEIIKSWFFENKPMRNECDLPTYIVASSKDRLVEFETARALETWPEAELYDPKCGHIGMIAGGHAVENVWQPIADWVHENDT